jgi:hypothetical protein
MAHEFDGKKYEKASAHQREWGARLISELSLKGDEHILDLGCGDGTNTLQKSGCGEKTRIASFRVQKLSLHGSISRAWCRSCPFSRNLTALASGTTWSRT